MKEKTKEKRGKRKARGVKEIREKCLLKRIYETGENVYVIFQPNKIVEQREKKNGIDD